MQALCQLEAQSDSFLPHLTEFIWEAAGSTELHNAETEELRPNIESVRSYAGQLARGVWENRERYDELIRGTAINWSPSRLNMVDRALLRLGLHEMLSGAAPPKVAINEAVELAKRYGTADSARFVNGVLDAMRKKVSASETAEDSPLATDH